MLDLDVFFADVEPEMRIHAHVLIGHPDQSKAADQVSAPVRVEQLVAGDDEKKSRDVMAEAVLAGEDEKELSPEQTAVLFALTDAVLARLPEDLFVSDGPGDAGDGNGQQEQPDNLQIKRHNQKSAISGMRVAFSRI